MSILFFVRAHKQRESSDLFLGFLLTLFSLRVAYWMLGFAGWFDAHDWHTTFMFYFPFNHWLAVGPLVYFYFRRKSNRDFSMSLRDYLHWLPAIIYFLRYIIYFVVDVVVVHWLGQEPFPYFYETRGELKTTGLGFPNNFWEIIETISLVTYLVLTMKHYRQYRVYIQNNFSTLEHIELRWLRNFILVNLIGVLIWIGFNLANVILPNQLTYIQDWYSFFLLGIILYYLSIAGYHGNRTFAIHDQLEFSPSTAPEDPISSTKTDDQTKAVFVRLDEYMKDERPFINPELNLNSLAKQLSTNSSVLSKAINQHSGKNFNDYINYYRIEAFKININKKDARQFSLLAHAQDSGFNSKATFNRAFKKAEQMSPTEFIKRNTTQ